MSKDVVTSVNAQGKASADFDRARFAISIHGRGKNVAVAKSAAEPVVGNVTQAIKKLADAEGVNVDKDSVKSNYSTCPEYEYPKSGRPKLAGYTASYHILFETTSLDKAAVIQDTLTSIKDAVVNDVEFLLKDSESLKKLALKDAFDKASARFEAECTTLGKDKKDYEIVSWDTNYGDGQHRPTRAAMAANAAQASPVEVESGKAEVTVTLTVRYAHRA